MTFTLPEQFVELPPLEFTDTDVRTAIAAIQQNLQALAGLFPLGSANLALRTVRGKVQGTTGTTLTGERFTCTRTGVGNYTITFTPVFKGVPVVVAGSSANGIGVAYDIEAFGATTNGFAVTVRQPGVAFLDNDFSFVAVGP